MSVMSEYMKKLQLEGQEALGKLDLLDETLDALRTVTVTDGMTSSDEREAITDKFWTRMGGNRAALRETDKKLGLLADVNIWRQHAGAHIAAALITLEQYMEDIEELRVRVATPALVHDIPLEVHAQSIDMGIRRLREMSAGQHGNRPAALDAVA